MTSTTFSSLTVRERAWLVTVAVLPLVVLVAARQLGVMSLLRLAVAGGVGVVFLTAVFIRPLWGVLFMAFYVYSGLHFYVPGVVSLAVMAVLVLAAVLELFSGGRDRVVDPMFWGSVAIFTMLALNSSVTAHFPELSIVSLIAFAKALALTLLIVHFVRTPGDLHLLVVTIFVGAIATIVFGVINLKLGLYTEDNVIQGVGVFRFSGTHEDPNDAAGLMCSSIPLGVYLMRHPPRRWVRWAALVGVLVLMVGMFSTFSRSAILAFALVTVVVMVREVRSRSGYFVALCVLLLAALLAPGYYWARLIALQETLSSNVNQDFSAMLRLEATATAWRLFLDNPWAGIGFGNFIQRGAISVIYRIVVHNTYLEVLVSAGILGLVAFLGIFISGLRACVRAARNAALSHVDRALAFYVGLSLVSIMTSSVFLSIHFKYTLWMPLATALALGNVLGRRS